MKRLIYIALSVCALCSVLCTPVAAQDVVRLGERDLVGTARYVGMSGAMTAIGGDPSAVRDNPAGLGLYRRPEVTLTIDYGNDRTIQANSNLAALRTHRVSVPQAAVVFSFGNPLQDKGLVYNNLMFSYHRLRTYSRSYQAGEIDGYSLATLIAETGVNLGIDYPKDKVNEYNTFRLTERGIVDEFSIDWAMNISHKLYLGLGVRMQTYTMTGDATYFEEFSTLNPEGRPYSLENSTWLHFAGVGCTFSVGAIYRPIRWLRMGVSLETPSLGGLSTYTSGTLYAQTDSLRSSKAPDQSDYDRRYHSPLRLSTSVAGQLGNFGMIALQYDYAHTSSYIDVHSLRAGVEIVPIPGMYINAGYTYEWNQDRKRAKGAPESVVPLDPTFNRQDAYFLNLHTTQYASVGLGYRGHYILVQAAYQYRWQRMNLYAHENQPYAMQAGTHRVVLTIGWHRDWP